MTGPAFERILDALRAAGRPVKMDGRNRARSSCPGHDGDNPSALSIMDTADRVNLHCFTQECDGADILAGLGMQVRDRYHQPRGNTLAQYNYPNGRVVRRHENKGFSQANTKNPPVLYRDPRDAIKRGLPIYLVEGEEDVHALEAVGIACATSAPQGGGNFAKVTDLDKLTGARVVAVVDWDGDAPADDNAVKWMHSVRDLVGPLVESLTFVHAKVGKDVADHLAAGCTVSQLRVIVPEEMIPTGEASDGSDASDVSDGSGAPPIHRGIRLSGDARENGATLLDEVRAWLARHITVMKAGDLDVLTLWAAHTHLVPRLYSTPRLQIDSPVPESGKTTVLEHLERLTYNAVNASSLSSPALLARLVGHDPRTVLLDEVDRTLDPKKEGVGELLAIVNTGYKFGGKRPTLVPVKDGGWKAEELSTFAPIAMAGNQPNLPDDTRTRIIRILLLPDWQGVAEESDWEMLEGPASTLGARLARWARHADVSVRPTMPEGCTGRFREKWQPLARVAHAAGGAWVDSVLALAAEDVANVAADREEGLAATKPKVLILRHILDVWPEGETFMGTNDLIALLVAEHPLAWGDESPYGKALTSQRLGRMLTEAYGVRSTQRDRADKNSTRGYRRAQFGAAARALDRPTVRPEVPKRTPPQPSEPSEPSEPSDKNSMVATALVGPGCPVKGPDGPHGWSRVPGCWSCDVAHGDQVEP